MSAILILPLCVLAIAFVLAWLLKPVRRLYYKGKSIFRGKWFHTHYIDQDGHFKIVYRTDFGLRFWTLMGRLYSVAVFFIITATIVVFNNGNKGFALPGEAYAQSEPAMVFNLDDFKSEVGEVIQSDDYVTIRNDAGEKTFHGFVIGKYYEEPITPLSVPGLFVRSLWAEVKVATRVLATLAD